MASIVFLSKSLSPVEQNYEVHNKELLAVMRSLEQWRHFLEGAKHSVEIWSNHKNLEYFQMAPEPQPTTGPVVTLPLVY